MKPSQKVTLSKEHLRNLIQKLCHKGGYTHDVCDMMHDEEKSYQLRFRDKRCQEHGVLGMFPSIYYLEMENKTYCLHV